MAYYASIDGSFGLHEEELVRMIQSAYERTGLRPARGIWGMNDQYASPAAVLLKAYGEIPTVDLNSHSGKEWLIWFQIGFEEGERHTKAGHRPDESEDFLDGYNTGCVIASKVLNE